MRIDDIPRPWLLAAVTGVSMSALLKQADREASERSGVVRGRFPDEHAGPVGNRRLVEVRGDNVVRLQLPS